jgi:hypothetical protein
MLDKNSQMLAKKEADTEKSTVLMRPYLTVILGTLDLMREGVFDDLDQKKKTQLINDAFSSAQELNNAVNKLTVIKPQAGINNLSRFYITLLKKEALTIPPQS